MAESPSSSEPLPKAGQAAAHGWSDERAEQVVGNLLRVGVVLSALVVGLGGLLFLVREGPKPEQIPHEFHPEAAEDRRPLTILRDAWRLKSDGLIELGLLLLILTPIARVAFSVLAFALQRDRVYVLVTLLVLAILLYSLFSGHIH
jgi:uncharacterized membrane protein